MKGMRKSDRVEKKKVLVLKEMDEARESCGEIDFGGK
jgi:hypothetical protein